MAIDTSASAMAARLLVIASTTAMTATSNASTSSRGVGTPVAASGVNTNIAINCTTSSTVSAGSRHRSCQVLSRCLRTIG
jgi:hypothetical protein